MLVVTLSNFATKGKLFMDIVADSLLNEEVRRKERGFSIQSEANFVDNHGRNENRGRNKGHDKSRRRSKSRPKFVCYYCGKPCHKKFDCRYYKRDQKAGKVIQDQIAHKKEDKNITAAVAKDDNHVFLIGEENYLNLADDDCTWIVDSGVAFHVTPHEHFFLSYQGCDFHNFKMGNQVSSKIVGIGNITLITNTGCKLMLKDVRHVLDICLNLISTGKLDDVDLVNHFAGGM